MISEVSLVKNYNFNLNTHIWFDYLFPAFSDAWWLFEQAAKLRHGFDIDPSQTFPMKGTYSALRSLIKHAVSENFPY